MLTSKRNGTLYVGVTTDLQGRVWEHRNGIYEGFSKRYGVDRLVWYRGFENVVLAIKFEKQLKRWRRAWKLELIEDANPEWADLFEQINF